mmetsp:Transcript_19638/g.36661  ORF Transcript_19638/g.36661 Transcript_19638/m.36661 type:complete len:116 (+) Transcript_19638:2078-2425(+)
MNMRVLLQFSKRHYCFRLRPLLSFTFASLFRFQCQQTATVHQQHSLLSSRPERVPARQNPPQIKSIQLNRTDSPLYTSTTTKQNRLSGLRKHFLALCVLLTMSLAQEVCPRRTTG